MAFAMSWLGSIFGSAWAKACGAVKLAAIAVARAKRLSCIVLSSVSSCHGSAYDQGVGHDPELLSLIRIVSQFGFGGPLRPEVSLESEPRRSNAAASTYQARDGRARFNMGSSFES